MSAPAATCATAAGSSTRARPPEQALQLAWRHLRRPQAPATLEAALEHAAWGPTLLALAWRLSRVPPCSAAEPSPLQAATAGVAVPAASAPPAPKPAWHPLPGMLRRPLAASSNLAPRHGFSGPVPHLLHSFPTRGQAQASRIHGPGWLDRKRAAANDRDDDNDSPTPAEAATSSHAG